MFFFVSSVCSWSVSEPLNHTYNDADDSVSVTCVFKGDEKFQLEAKLKMNKEYVCEVYNKSQVQEKKKHDCDWQHKDNTFTFTFTLMKPESLLKNTFSCEMSKIKPFPVLTREGPKIKLFRGKFTQHGASVNPFYILRNAFKECGIFQIFFFLSISFLTIFLKVAISLWLHRRIVVQSLTKRRIPHL